MMQEHFRKFGKFGLVMGTIILPMVSYLYDIYILYIFNNILYFIQITSEGGHTVDIDELCDKIADGTDVDGSVFVSDESKNRLVKRLRDVVIDMVRLNYI